MRRRELMALVGGAATLPFHAIAQQATRPAIGFLGNTLSATFKPHVDAFRRGLTEAGYADGQDVAIEYRWADDRYERFCPRWRPSWSRAASL